MLSSTSSIITILTHSYSFVCLFRNTQKSFESPDRCRLFICNTSCIAQLFRIWLFWVKEEKQKKLPFTFSFVMFRLNNQTCLCKILSRAICIPLPSPPFPLSLPFEHQILNWQQFLKISNRTTNPICTRSTF